MPLRAIDYHIDTLQKVIVLTSGASNEQFELFQKLVETFYPKLKGKLDKILVEPVNEKFKSENAFANSFEDLEAVAKAVNKAYEELERKKIDAKDTIIDVTGGQKSNSIATAVITVLDNKEFQYISTVDYAVRAYNVKLK